MHKNLQRRLSVRAVAGSVGPIGITRLRRDRNQQLIDAVTQGTVRQVTEALLTGANPNAWVDSENPDVCRVLGLAVSRGCLKMVSALVSHGAEPTAISLAAASNQVAILRRLLRATKRRKRFYRAFNELALLRAAEEGATDAVSVLVDHGVHVNALEGRPLRAAAAAGHLEVMQLLLSRGGDPNTAEGSALRRIGTSFRASNLSQEQAKAGIRLMLGAGADLKLALTPRRTGRLLDDIQHLRDLVVLASLIGETEPEHVVAPLKGLCQAANRIVVPRRHAAGLGQIAKIQRSLAELQRELSTAADHFNFPHYPSLRSTLAML